MVAAKFDALLTFDKNLQHQQNFSKYSITVFVLTALNNTYDLLKPLTYQVNELLAGNKLAPGPIIISFK
jgi:hypothetical protein